MLRVRELAAGGLVLVVWCWWFGADGNSCDAAGSRVGEELPGTRVIGYDEDVCRPYALRRHGNDCISTIRGS